MAEPVTSAQGLVFALARVIIELESALTLGTGRGDDVHDSTCVTDANDLPALPGSSLAGVLRAAWERIPAAERRHSASDLFGFQERDGGRTSQVEVSWGVAHDSANRPVAARMGRGEIERDPVLVALQVGVLRDHVRIGHDGVAERNGKFDQLLVPAGARFSFELLVRGTSKAEAGAVLAVLLDLLRSGEVRLGASTRRGHGAFKVVAAPSRAFDLREEADRKVFRELPRALRDGAKGLVEAKPGATARRTLTRIELELEAQDCWIFGTGTPVREEHFRTDGRPEGRVPIGKIPVTEARIAWSDHRGSVREGENADVLVPASGVKGAIRHRTLFHARRRSGAWAPVDASAPLYQSFRGWANDLTCAPMGGGSAGDRPSVYPGAVGGAAESAVHWLFGNVDVQMAADGREADVATAGRVYLSDLYFTAGEAKSAPIQHVSLDRFTMGPMDGLLFDEAPIAKGPNVKLVFLVDARDDSPVAADALRALRAALFDLAEGRLALGAGGNRGHGYFRATQKSLDNLRQVLGGAA